MKITPRETYGAVILDVTGKLMGGPDADKFQSVFKKLLEDGKKNVIVNLEKVNWINSTGLGILISGYTTMRKGGGNLKLLNVSDRIESILMVTKLATIFEVYNDESEAVNSFHAASG
jgi:anti-sigma B factor antagonist